MSGLPWSAIAAGLLLGYLLGSVPWGLLLTRMAGLGDVRAIGSGNIGATNVLRTGNKGLAALTLLLDVLKGTAAVLIAAQWGNEASLAAGFGAFLGHIFPVWLGFKGGKGVATFLGVLIAVAWKAALVFAVTWLAVAFLSRFSSLAALVASLATPAVLYIMDMPQSAAVLGMMTVLVYLKHHANISRLLRGKESKIGAKG